MAMSEIRPPMMAGPMARALRPLSWASLMGWAWAARADRAARRGRRRRSFMRRMTQGSPGGGKQKRAWRSRRGSARNIALAEHLETAGVERTGRKVVVLDTEGEGGARAGPHQEGIEIVDVDLDGEQGAERVLELGLVGDFHG